MEDGGHGWQLDPGGTAFESAWFSLVFSLGWNFKLQCPRPLQFLGLSIWLNA